MGLIRDDHKTEICAVCEYCHLNNCHHEVQSLFYISQNLHTLANQHKVYQSLQSPVAIAAAIMYLPAEEAFKNHCNFEKICCFAWNMYKQKKFIFWGKDLNDAKYSLGCKEKNIFLRCIKEYAEYELREGVCVFFFSHVLVQELLAALWLLTRKHSEFITLMESNFEFFKEKRFGVVKEFMKEICHNSRLELYLHSEYWDIKRKNYEELSTKKLNK